MLPRPPWRSMLKPYAASISLLTPISPSPPPFPHISHLPAQRAEPTAWAKPAGKPCTKRADASTSSNYCLTQHSPEVLSSPKKEKKRRKLSCQKAFLLHKTDSVGNLPLKHPLAILSHTAAMQAAASIPALSSDFPLDKGSTAAGSNADPHMSLLSPTSA